MLKKMFKKTTKGSVKEPVDGVAEECSVCVYQHGRETAEFCTCPGFARALGHEIIFPSCLSVNKDGHCKKFSSAPGRGFNIVTK